MKYLADFDNGYSFKSEDWSSDGTPIIRIENLNGSQNFNCFEGVVRDRHRVTAGDLLFSWSGNRGTSFGPHIWTRPGEYYLNQHIFRVRERGVDRRWLYWALKAATEYIEQQADGIIGMVHVTKAELGAIPLPVPTLLGQRAIADYLDTETARIDALITKKQQLVAAVEERPWSELLDRPELRSKTVALRRAILQITDGPFGSSLTSSHYVDEPECRVVRLGNIGFAEFRDVDRAYISNEYGRSLARHKVEAGDLLIAGLGDSRNHVGRATVAPEIGEAIVKADCYCAKVNPKRALARYLAIVLSSPLGRDRVGIAGRGTTRSRINLEIAKEIELPLPSLQSQADIIERFDADHSAAVAVAEAINTQIDLLQERRRALVTAAVTGEFRVPGVA